ncbi:MAG: hypothetical protein PF542_05345 [Nanoarchaeota archaeon]|jgi:hypothetical protein|nr:hypothetical protein [Nanoarchaeota archaeon]
MVEKVFNVRRFFGGIVMLGVGIVIMMDGSEIGALLSLVGILMMVFCMDKRQLWYCADCGNYIGSTKYDSNYLPRVSTCSRCRCNVFTREYSGSGKTRRNR